MLTFTESLSPSATSLLLHLSSQSRKVADANRSDSYGWLEENVAITLHCEMKKCCVSGSISTEIAGAATAIEESMARDIKNRKI